MLLRAFKVMSIITREVRPSASSSPGEGLPPQWFFPGHRRSWFKKLTGAESVYHNTVTVLASIILTASQAFIAILAQPPRRNKYAQRSAVNGCQAGRHHVFCMLRRAAATVARSARLSARQGTAPASGKCAQPRSCWVRPALLVVGRRGGSGKVVGQAVGGGSGGGGVLVIEAAYIATTAEGSR